MKVKTVSAKTALVKDQTDRSEWCDDVEIDIDESGQICAIRTVANGSKSSGILLPGIANLHSHAHQRAMAGLAECAGDTSDSFWTWRTTMYGFLESIDPDDLNAIASQLYMEMLKAGYTRVAEFQYLHHQRDGRPYSNRAEMSLSTLHAAQAVGLGITNLPVHYQFGGFGGQAIKAQQCRFANDPEAIASIVQALIEAAGEDQNVVTGIAAHSLRAVTKEAFSDTLNALSHISGLPIHIHIAEQTKEVDDCIAWSGCRPVRYLYDHFGVDERWCLIHATHMDDNETQTMAKSGAIAGLCPTTEGNLGDGFFNATDYLMAGGAMGIGSDSHISISPNEEIRWFEYGQRLIHHSRNQLSGGINRSTGKTLFDLSVDGGAKACAHNSGAIAVGKRADFILLDDQHPLLCQREGDEIIDSWIFSGNQNTVKDVYVGGQKVIENGHHKDETRIEQRFRQTLGKLRENQ